MLKNKKIVGVFIFILFIFYFQYSVTIAWDSADYMNYVNIFEGNQPWSSWNIVRGSIFPLIIFVGNFIFGKSSQGITVMTFIFYLFTLFFYFKIVEDFMLYNLNIKQKKKNIIECIFIVFTVLNPIIFGYFHCLLTEFVGINISIISCYFAYKWLNSNFFETRKKYILFSLYFIIMIPISWHLKQPYVSCALFAFFITYLISVFENKKIKSIIVRTITLFSCILMLFISIKIWNLFLKKINVDPSEDRNPTVILSTQVLNGTDIVRIKDSNDIKNLELYIKKTKLNKEEKKAIRNYWSKGKRFFILNTYEDGKIINSDYVYNKGHRISFLTSISYVLKTFIDHPILLSSSYASNYLATINVYRTEPYMGGYRNTHVFDLKYSNEISSLGYRPYNYNKTSNILNLTPELYQNVKYYEQVNNSCPLVNSLMKFLTEIYSIIYKGLFVLLPFSLLFTIIWRIIEKNQKLKIKLNLCIILFGFSFLHVFLHVFLGALIDRYTVPAILTNFMGMFCFLFCIILKYSKKINLGEI